MNISEEVRPGANRYVSGQGILQDLESYRSEERRVGKECRL